MGQGAFCGAGGASMGWRGGHMWGGGSYGVGGHVWGRVASPPLPLPSPHAHLRLSTEKERNKKLVSFTPVIPHDVLMWNSNTNQITKPQQFGSRFKLVEVGSVCISILVPLLDRVRVPCIHSPALAVSQTMRTAFPNCENSLFTELEWVHAEGQDACGHVS